MNKMLSRQKGKILLKPFYQHKDKNCDYFDAFLVLGQIGEEFIASENEVFHDEMVTRIAYTVNLKV